jgi:hypothetical protein
MDVSRDRLDVEVLGAERACQVHPTQDGNASILLIDCHSNSPACAPTPTHHLDYLLPVKHLLSSLSFFLEA